jgi:hypothetical protein
VVHGYCHHKALMGMDDEETILQRLGLDYPLVDSGCCSMAADSASSAIATRHPSLSANVCCCPRCAARLAMRFSSPMGSVVASRSSKPLVAARCTWPKFCN